MHPTMVCNYVTTTNVIVRSLFCFAPRWALVVVGDQALSPPLGQGGFVGSLAHLRTPLGSLVSVASNGSALVWAVE
jgi:hypothetical protein